MTTTRRVPKEDQKRRHSWIRSTAFTAITGVRKVCMDCGQTDKKQDRYCPGKIKTP